jgi:hypothetical protein
LISIAFPPGEMPRVAPAVKRPNLIETTKKNDLGSRGVPPRSQSREGDRKSVVIELR